MWRANASGCCEAGEDSNGFEEEEQRKRCRVISKGGGDTTATTTIRGITFPSSMAVLIINFVQAANEQHEAELRQKDAEMNRMQVSFFMQEGQLSLVPRPSHVYVKC